MNRDSTRPGFAQTEEIGVLRTPAMAETLPPSRLAGLSPELASKAVEAGSTPPSSLQLSAGALDQLDHLSALVDREARTADPPAVLASTPAPAVSQWEAVRDASGEEPLEAYLDRFMERLVGKKGDSATSLEKTMPASGSGLSNSIPLATTQPVPDQAGSDIASAPREPVKAPECRETLAVMRELANHNARRAVADHRTANLGGRARLALAASASLSLTSSAAAVAALACHSAACLWLASGLGLLAAAPAYRFFRLCRQYQSQTEL